MKEPTARSHRFGGQGIMEDALVDVDEDGAVVVRVVLAQLRCSAGDLRWSRNSYNSGLER